MALKRVRWPKSLEMLFISQRCIVAQKVGNGIKTGTLAEKLIDVVYFLTLYSCAKGWKWH